MTDSATGGYLLPAPTPAPAEGQTFQDFLGDLVAGVTGLDRDELVRPRWQPEPPNPPAAGVAWCAFGLQNFRTDSHGYIAHDPGSESPVVAPSDQLSRLQFVDLLASFYDLGAGADADELAQRLCDGLLISQNREALLLAGVVVRRTGTPVPLPSLLKERWLYRVDVTVELQRQIRRSYPILNVASASVHLMAQEPGASDLVIDTTINVTGP